MLSAKLFFFVFAVTLRACQSEEVQIGSQRMEARFLGTLNRYYVSWNLSESDDDENGSGMDLSGSDLFVENSDDSINQLNLLDGTQNVVIVVHGRQGSAYSEFANSLRSGFINNQPDIVVFLVDWSLVSALDYAQAVNSVSFVADDIISFIIRLDSLGKINRNLVHLVGFDLGAHIAGIVSRDQRARVQRITGLSPAGQLWDSNSRRLRASDAEYVECLHTDYTGARAFGVGDQVGTVDIYANTGTRQPGCANNQCYHDRAWQLFVASLEMGGHLAALGCNSLADMTRNLCVNPPSVTLGTNTLSTEASGIYRVNTGRVYPYNL